MAKVMEETAVRIPFLAAAILILAAGCGGQGPGATATRGPSATATSAGATATAAAACTGTGGGSQVSIADSTFSPASVSVAVGGEVTWTNADAFAHTVTFDDVDCGSVAGGATVSRTFDTAGEFAYSCTIHPSMRGTVTVQ